MSYLLDVNVLVDATNAGSRRHDAVRGWLDGVLTGPRRSVGIPWHSALGFVRVVTNHKIFPDPVSVPEAWAVVQEWLDAPAAWLPEPTERHRALLGQVVDDVELASALVSDVHLATLAIEHGVTMVSADKGFARFADTGRLRWIDPAGYQEDRR